MAVKIVAPRAGSNVQRIKRSDPRPMLYMHKLLESSGFKGFPPLIQITGSAYSGKSAGIMQLAWEYAKANPSSDTKIVIVHSEGLSHVIDTDWFKDAFNKADSAKLYLVSAPSITKISDVPELLELGGPRIVPDLILLDIQICSGAMSGYEHEVLTKAILRLKESCKHLAFVDNAMRLNSNSIKIMPLFIDIPNIICGRESPGHYHTHNSSYRSNYPCSVYNAQYFASIVRDEELDSDTRLNAALLMADCISYDPISAARSGLSKPVQF